VSSAGQEVVELAASAGLILDQWQAAVLDGALGERKDGTWAAFEVGLVVPRQNGKGALLEAVELAGLFLFGEELILHSAHEFKTAADAFRRVMRLIQSCSDMEKRVARVRTSHGDEGIELKGGQRLRFVARSTGSGRGFSADRIILDEAYNLSGQAMAALLPTMAARPNPQLWYTSSAPLPRSESDTLRALCRRGRAGKADRLAYFEWCASPEPPSLDSAEWEALVASLCEDPEALPAANPSLGIRIGGEFVESERSAMPAEDFARERYGVFPNPSDGAEKVIPLDKWDACLDAASAPAAPVFAFDVSPDRSSSSIAAAGVNAAGLRHVEVTGRDAMSDHRPGTGWLVCRLVEILEQTPGSTVVVDATGPAGSLLPDLRAALEAAGSDATVREVSFAEHKQAVGQFYDSVMQGTLAHLGQTAVRLALSGASKRPMGDAWLWSRQRSSVDITPLVACTLAAWAVGLVVEAKESDFFLI